MTSPLMTPESAAIGGALGEKYGRNPAAFMRNAVRAHPEKARDLLRRLVRRTGKTEQVAEDEDFRGPPPRLALSPEASDDASRITAKLALFFISHPHIAVDEARRQTLGLPVAGLDSEPTTDGSESGGDGSDWAPVVGEGIKAGAEIFGAVFGAITGGGSSGSGSSRSDDSARDSSSDSGDPLGGGKLTESPIGMVAVAVAIGAVAFFLIRK